MRAVGQQPVCVCGHRLEQHISEASPLVKKFGRFCLVMFCKKCPGFTEEEPQIRRSPRRVRRISSSEKSSRIEDS